MLAATERHKRNIILDISRRWPKEIPFIIDGIYTDTEKEVTRKAVSSWQENTCLNFIEKDFHEAIQEKTLFFTKSFEKGCYSFIGKTKYKSNLQGVFLESTCLNKYYRIAVHEIGHALGLSHEQNRPDRDQYVIIHTSNILRHKLNNFAKKSSERYDTMGMVYDYTSAMHYSKTAFSKHHGTTTIETIDPLFKNTIGQRGGLSFHDIRIINLAYCKDTCAGAALSCYNDGYLDPLNCSKCKCPDPWGDDDCSKVIYSGSPGCYPSSGILQYASGNVQCVQSPNYMNGSYLHNDSCTWHIKLDGNSHLLLWFTGNDSYPRINQRVDYLEIKTDLNQSISPRFSGYSLSDFNLTKSNPLVLNCTQDVLLLFRTHKTVKDFPSNYSYGFELCYQVYGSSFLGRQQTTLSQTMSARNKTEIVANTTDTTMDITIDSTSAFTKESELNIDKYGISQTTLQHTTSAKKASTLETVVSTTEVTVNRTSVSTSTKDSEDKFVKNGATLKPKTLSKTPDQTMDMTDDSASTFANDSELYIEKYGGLERWHIISLAILSSVVAGLTVAAIAVRCRSRTDTSNKTQEIKLFAISHETK